MGKIVELVTPPKPDANQRLIDLLRETLREVKAGRVQGIGMALACTHPNGDGGRTTETIISFSEGWSHTALAAIAALHHRAYHERYVAGTPLPDPDLKPDDE